MNISRTQVKQDYPEGMDWLFTHFPRTSNALAIRHFQDFKPMADQLRGKNWRQHSSTLNHFIKQVETDCREHFVDLFKWEKRLSERGPIQQKQPILSTEMRMECITTARFLQQVTHDQLLQLSYRLSDTVVVGRSKWDWSSDNNLYLSNLDYPADELFFLQQHVYYDPGTECFPLRNAAILLLEMKSPCCAGELLAEVLENHIAPDQREAFQQNFLQAILSHVYYGTLVVCSDQPSPKA